MAANHTGHFSLVQSLAKLFRSHGDILLDGSSTLTLTACSLQQLTRLFQQHLPSSSQQHGFLALPSHPADTADLLELQFLFDVLQKTTSLKLINPPETEIRSVVKIFPFKSLRCLELKRIPAHCLEGLRGIYSQLVVFTCYRSLRSLEEMLSSCGGDLSSALPWLELRVLNFSYNFITHLDQSLSLLNVLKSLDLSHNNLQGCAEFLKPLSELEHLNLGYNSLQRVPTLSPMARANLTTLILRFNKLDSVNGVERLSSLRCLDLAHNLLFEHSQLAPLSLLYCLNTLTLEGNPLYYLKTHRASTVLHLSLKAVNLKFKLDGKTLSSSDLSVLPKGSHHVAQVYAPPPVAMAPERGIQEVSSGAGELSDSLSVGEVAVSSFRKKKSRSKVKVRRASISEPSDTDFVPRSFSSSQAIVLPHKQEIERMSSFRDQLGEDWLRYQHHLDATSPPDVADGLTNLSPPPLPPPPPPQEEEPEAEPETDSILQWPACHTQHTDSNLEDSLVDQPAGRREKSPSQSSRESQRSGGDANQEEDDLGVDLCHPVLVGVHPEVWQANGGQSSQVFLRVKRGLLLELDVQYGWERRRLELDSLLRLEATEDIWTLEGSDKLLPAIELHLDYISKDKQRRRYVLLDDDPAALQSLIDVLSSTAEENRRRHSKLLLPSCVRLQCLRCRSEFSRHRASEGEGDQEEEENKEEKEEKEEKEGDPPVCPDCGSDQVVQLVVQSAPFCSTPVRVGSRLSSRRSGPEDEDDQDVPVLQSFDLPSSITVDDPEFITAPSGSFFIRDGVSLGREELAGSYNYSPRPVRPEEAAEFSPDDDLDLLSEDFEAVDHRLQLFLDVEVFEEEEEELRCFLKMSAVKFGEPGEVPTLLVVSNQRIYFLEMTSDAKGHLADWLQKKESYSILELGYLEVGLASQSIHMEFSQGGMAYTLLVRDSIRCKRFFATLTGIVREMAHKSDSKLQSISTTRLTDQHHLWPLVCDDIQSDVEDGQLQFFYILAFVLQEDVWMPLTVLATRETLYLLQENHQWSKSRLGSSEIGVLDTLPISCVSSVLLWPQDQRRMDIKLYDETVKQERTWCVRSDSEELLQGLLSWVRTQWEAMFSVKLHTSLQDKAV